MRKPTVAIVAFFEQDNLGVGYLTSVLLNAGYQVRLVDFQLGKERVLEELREAKPVLVGFSIIFQYHIGRFGYLIRFLRNEGIRTHFCAGGHYPSLRPQQLLQMIPQLDSVGLYEGEWTFLELAEALSESRDWRALDGLAYLEKHSFASNPLRPLEDDLDRFPPPFRPPLKTYALGKKYATILAGRGCVYDCSFCSIRQFYSRPPGLAKRLRRPDMVVQEMELLRGEMDCSVFMFQDDDFPVSRPKGDKWIHRFCQLLESTGLGQEILWKISCRPDEVTEEKFLRMRNCGLFLVYLGIESGTEEGLRRMNKRTTPEVNINAVRTLSSLGIDFDFGFMLFDPSSTLPAVQENLTFLEVICGDGSSPVTFCKMRPYAETRVEAELRKQRRLRGQPGFEDYDFLDAKVGLLHQLATDWFQEWIGSRDGALNLSRWLRYYLAVYRHYFPVTSRSRVLETEARLTIRDANLLLLETVSSVCDLLANNGAAVPSADAGIQSLRNRVWTGHKYLQARLRTHIETIEHLGGITKRA